MTTRPLYPRSLPEDSLVADEPPPPYSESLPLSTTNTNSLSASPTYSPPAATSSPSPPRPQLIYPSHSLVPPPSYTPRNPPPAPASRRNNPPPSRTVGFVSYSEEKRRLQSLLSKHRWKTYYGPPPKTLTVALRKAALWGDRPFVNAILDIGGAEIWGQHPNTCVHEALRGSKPDIALDILNWWIENECSGGATGGKGVQWILDARDAATGVTPLHVAAEAGNVGVVMALVEMGGKVDSEDNLGRTPLLMAARLRRLEVVDGLLDCGADVNKVLGKRGLWDKWKEGSKERELLGGWEIVSGILRGAVARRRGFEIGDEEVEEFVEEEEELPQFEDGSQMSEGGGGLDLRDGSFGTLLRSPPPEEVESSGFAAAAAAGGEEASGSGRSSSPELALGHDALFRSITDIMDGSRTAHDRGINWQLIQAAMLASNLADTDPLVRRMLYIRGALNNPALQHSLMGSPEYQAWRADCEVLLAESRSQRERNRQAEARILERLGARR
ncbi:hypothetical protein QBC43DRAFT_339147 [Cladorrhinum sp. PSN259]|nr:hypothetical protein QBC43DRAFT_339147 [Cladorrhinum sp. PSN259]